MEVLYTDKASAPAGHYSQAVKGNGLIFVSGQLPVKPGGEKVLGSIEEQTKQSLSNVRAILEEHESGLDRVVKSTVYISDISLWDKVNKVYAEYFGDHKPSRAVVPTRELHYGFKVEIEVVALAKEQ